MFRRPLEQLAEHIWYGGSPLSWLLLPLSWLTAMVSRRRRRAYLAGPGSLLPARPIVLVVGNITVGGTGKTPLVIELAREFSGRGHALGVVLRGYGGEGSGEARLLKGDESSHEVGDEALVIKAATGLPVAVCAHRRKAVDLLHRDQGCELIISDDGLQHYAMPRHLEIMVMDGQRCLGNGRLLPAGPLREDSERLNSVDYVVTNGGDCGFDGVRMDVRPGRCQSLSTQEQRPLASFSGQRVRAVAAVGNPRRFFDSLKQVGLTVEETPYPDHHAFRTEDFQFKESLPILMTAKDAVKCKGQGLSDAWVVGAEVDIPRGFIDQLDARIRSLLQPL